MEEQEIGSRRVAGGSYTVLELLPAVPYFHDFLLPAQNFFAGLRQLQRPRQKGRVSARFFGFARESGKLGT